MPPAPPLAVTVWGGTSSLPSIDPTSLYVLALLQLAHVPNVCAFAPHSFFHTDAVPALYTQAPPTVTSPDHQHPSYHELGELIATTPSSIRTFLCEHSSLDKSLRDPSHAAKTRALHAWLDDELSDLVLHTLFSLPPNFQKVTCTALSGTRRRLIPSSLPRRMRAAVRARLESPNINLWGVGGSWERQERREAQRWKTTAGLAEARDPISYMPRPGFRENPNLASDVREEWERSRLVSRARRLFKSVAVYLQEREFLGHWNEPTSVDARLYSLLAPWVFVDWPVDPLPSLLRAEFPILVQHTKRMHEWLWQATSSSWAWHHQTISLWPSVSLPNRPSWVSLWRGLSSWWRSSANETSNLSPTLRYGRIAWMTSAILGPILWVLLSGIIVIEFVDENESVENEDDGDDSTYTHEQDENEDEDEDEDDQDFSEKAKTSDDKDEHEDDGTKYDEAPEYDALDANEWMDDDIDVDTDDDGENE